LRLRLAADGHCAVEVLDGTPAARATTALRVASAFDAAGWLVLRLGAGSGARVLVLAPDAAAEEELRQLRVWLKLVAPRAALNYRGAALS
jgi:hypothetical protein